MTDPIDVLIFTALLTRLMPNPALVTSDITSPPVPVAMPSIAYVPVTNKPYIEAHNILRAQPQSPTLDFAGSNLFKGIFQVDAVVPQGAGEVTGLRLAAAIAARFPQGLRLPCAPYQIKFNSLSSIAAAVTDAPWVRFPVSIPYLLIT